MSDKIICPLCGNENPADAKFCQVCKTDFTSLPQEMFPQHPAVQTSSPDNSDRAKDSQSDSVIPKWLQERFQAKRDEGTQSDSFQNYIDVLFSGAAAGDQKNKISENPTPELAAKAAPPEDSAIFAEDSNGKTDSETALYSDFSTFRPVRKWDDPAGNQESSKSDTKDIAAEDSLDGTSAKSEALQQEDPYEKYSAPLFALSEEEENDGENDFTGAEIEDPAFMNSTSINKLAEGAALSGLEQAEDAPEANQPADEPLPEAASAAETEHQTEEQREPLQPELPGTAEAIPEPTSSDGSPVSIGEDNSSQTGNNSDTENIDTSPDALSLNSGSLVADFMNQFDQDHVPDDQNEPSGEGNGTLFFSENSPSETPISESAPAENTDAIVLEQILYSEGYHRESEANLTETSANKNSEASETPSEEKKNSEPESEEPERSEVSAESQPRPETESTPNPEEKPESVEAEAFDEIPWNLFESGEMNLPQGTVPPVYKTFSRGGIPQEPAETDYQQRMISMLLDKIIHMEGRNQGLEKAEKRGGGRIGQIICALIAIFGVLLILLSGISDSIPLPQQESLPEVQAFDGLIRESSGKVLIALDYTPAYEEELGESLKTLLMALHDQDCEVRMMTVNPASMGIMQQYAAQYENWITNLGYWPGDALAMQQIGLSSEKPDTVFLISANFGSAKNWAEQLQATIKDTPFGVIASSQLSSLLMPYRDSDMIDALISTLDERSTFVHEDYSLAANSRKIFAVWFLILFAVLAWIVGNVFHFMQSDPDYAHMPQSVNKTPHLARNTAISANPTREAEINGKEHQA